MNCPNCHAPLQRIRGGFYCDHCLSNFLTEDQIDFVYEECPPYELPTGRWTNVKEFWFTKLDHVVTVGYGTESVEIDIMGILLPNAYQSAREELITLIKGAMDHLYGGPVPYEVLLSLHNGFFGAFVKREDSKSPL
jgi:hypothetical protein